MKDKCILESFLKEEFELSQKEVTLYINLLKYGQLTIFELAKASEMNRSTTHVNVDSLIQKGLAAQLSKGRGSRRYIIPEPVEKLELLLKNKKAKLNAAENRFPDVMKKLRILKNTNHTNKNMEIRRYRGINEVKLIYDEVLEAKEIRSYLNYQELIKVFPANTANFLETHRKRNEMLMWEIMENSVEAREYASKTHPDRYYCKLTTQKLNLTSLDYILFDGKIAIIDLAKGIDVSGLVFENITFYENAKSIHKFIWQLLPNYKL